MDDMMWFLLGLMNGKGGKVKPLSVTENGTYNVSDVEKAEGYVGYCPVTVDVPDRYQEGYDKGHDDGVKSVAISPLTVTANGTYSAADYSCNGFDPVNVNVPCHYEFRQESPEEVKPGQNPYDALAADQPVEHPDDGPALRRPGGEPVDPSDAAAGFRITRRAVLNVHRHIVKHALLQKRLEHGTQQRDGKKVPEEQYRIGIHLFFHPS